MPNFDETIREINMLKNTLVTILILAVMATMIDAKEESNHVVNMGSSMVLKDKLARMSTTELEQKVEECTQKGTMPFEMGVELINRWTKKTS